VTFIGLSIFTRPSAGLSRFVRFNIQQVSRESRAVRCRSHRPRPPSLGLPFFLPSGSGTRYSAHRALPVRSIERELAIDHYHRWLQLRFLCNGK
jgi:hypothetical protein